MIIRHTPAPPPGQAERQLSPLLLPWYRRQGRHDLPWQQQTDPWRVWVSEIMLQQTQVTTVIPYFERFIQRFPNVEALAGASMDEVLGLWAGLGYYARARNLKRGAEQVVREHGGRIPEDIQQLQSLPGIGRSSAGAILSFACGQRHPILDGNAKRVLARCFAIAGWPGQAGVARRLWQLAEACTPQRGCREYNQAIMDLGALLCRRSRPRCAECPLVTLCQAARRGEQQRYPGRRVSRPLPLRRARFLILEREDGSILLVRRAPSGVWGGLWCLPEIPGEDDAGSGSDGSDSGGGSGEGEGESDNSQQWRRREASGDARDGGDGGGVGDGGDDGVGVGVGSTARQNPARCRLPTGDNGRGNDAGDGSDDGSSGSDGSGGATDNGSGDSSRGDGDDSGARQWVARQLGFTTRLADSPPSFYHCFSHYRLHICPLRLVITGQDTDRCREHPDHRWYNAGDERDLGLPAPIKTLLQDCVQQGKQRDARDRARAKRRAEQGGQRP